VGTATTGTTSRFIRFYAAATTDNNGTGVGRVRLNTTGVAYESGGADFAEYMPASEGNLVPGEVVYRGAAGVGRATSSNSAAVVGVISDTAAFVGNAPDDDVPNYEAGKAIVGLVGQIKTKVSTENGVIHAGDPIGPSSVPGVGAKALSSGFIVGKAMEDYDGTGGDNGVKKVNVLVSVSWYEPNLADQQFSGIVIGMNNLSPDVSAAISEIPQIKSEIAAIASASVSGE
jgi:hypothetical protein